MGSRSYWEVTNREAIFINITQKINRASKYCTRDALWQAFSKDYGFFSNLVGEEGPRILGAKGSSVCFQTTLSSFWVSFQLLLYLKEYPRQPFFSVMLNWTFLLQRILLWFVFYIDANIAYTTSAKLLRHRYFRVFHSKPWTLGPLNP